MRSSAPEGITSFLPAWAFSLLGRMSGRVTRPSYPGGMALTLPRTLSPSKVVAFTNCPLAFRFSQIERRPEPPSPPAVKGTLVHAARAGAGRSLIHGVRGCRWGAREAPVGRHDGCGAHHRLAREEPGGARPRRGSAPLPAPAHRHLLRRLRADDPGPAPAGGRGVVG